MLKKIKYHWGEKNCSLTLVPAHRLQKVLETCDSQQRQKQDRLVSSVTAALDRSVGSRLEQLVKAEFSRTVVPSVYKIIPL